MAALDKLYFDSAKEIKEFYEWAEMFDDYCIKETQLSLIDCFYIRSWWFKDDNYFYSHKIPVINTPISIDRWLWKHCPLPCVREKMRDWWGYDKDYKDTLFYIDRAFDRDKWRKTRNLKVILSDIEFYQGLLKDYPDDKSTKKSIDKLTFILKAIYQNNYRHLLNQDNWETSYLF